MSEIEKLNEAFERFSELVTEEDDHSVALVAAGTSESATLQYKGSTLALTLLLTRSEDLAYEMYQAASMALSYIHKDEE